MKKLIPVLMAMLIAAPAFAADDAAANLQAQCEAQATQQGLKGEEASDFVADCMEQGEENAAPQDNAAKTDE